MKKRIISMALVLLLVLSLMPTVFAADSDTVYLSVSYDGSFVTASGTAMAYVAVPLSELEKISLTDYGMGDYLYDADSDGVYEITALHLFIYAQEKLYGGSWSDVNCSGDAGSLYFGGGLFGFTENMTYYHNGGYPIDTALSESWGFTAGATADHIVLKVGDYVDVAGYSDFGFYFDPSAGFRYFLDDSGNVTHSYSCSKDGSVTVTLATATQDWSTGNLVMGSAVETGDTVYYSQTLLDASAKSVTTDENGKAVITPDAYGTWYVWSLGDSVSSPAYAEISVNWVNPGTVTADWYNFRNSDVNMAITNAATPTSAETSYLKWAVKMGEGWSAAPSIQIIVDNSLVVMSGSTIYKLDLQTGETRQTGTLATTTGYGYTPMTYADGLIFCPETSGTIQAFDADTLGSVWVYTDALGGQSLSPITYSDGYVYTGFWNSEKKDANFVCINATTGKLEWSYTATGGFYWAGSVVVGNTVIVGTDDGESGYTGNSHLLSFDKKTGDVISDITLEGCGDQRSSIAYSADYGKVYFTTKNGYLCSAKLDSETGKLSDLQTVKQASQSTSTPIVYGDKVYFCCGSGVSSGTGGAGNFVVASAETLEQYYAVALQAYPQGSALMSTAYLESTGKLYFYTTYNGNPGGISLITVDPTATTAESAELIEIFDAAGYEQYCITSPICGSDGTIYYKNDSCYVFALGTNNAYLTDLAGDTGYLNGTFSASTTSVEWIVPIGTETVTFTPTAGAGGSAEAVTVTLVDGVATAKITAVCGSDTREYTVSVREISNDASLSELLVSESNTYNQSVKEITPAFDSNTYYYLFTGIGSSRSFENVWPTASDANATVSVYSLSNVKKFTTATNLSHKRWAVYFEDSTQPMAVRIEVTAEDGTICNYYVVMSKSDAAEAAQTLLDTYQNCAHANAELSGVKEATCTEDGYTGDKTCPDCGATIQGEVIPAAGHTSTDVVTAPTCTEGGYTTHTCDICEDVWVGSYTDALGHDYVDGICSVCGEADPDYKTAEGTVNVYVTISDKGNVVMSQQSVTVADVNHNGIFDVDDALYAAHEAAYEGGAAAGYSSYTSSWGLSISMLWGDTSWSYGYWLNDASCWSLSDEVADGNYLTAFVYADSTYWTDAYARLDAHSYTATAETAFVISLEAAGYDASWNTVFAAHSGATVTVYDADDNALTEGCTVVDNGDGTYSVTVEQAGDYTIVVTDTAANIVPAVAKLTVTAKTVADDTKDDVSDSTEDKKDDASNTTEDKKDDASNTAEDKKDDVSNTTEDKKDDASNITEVKTDDTNPKTGDGIASIAAALILSALSTTALITKKRF